MVLYKKQLEELDALAESVFYDVFGDPVTNEKGWKLVKLGSLGEWASGGVSFPFLGQLAIRLLI